MSATLSEHRTLTVMRYGTDLIGSDKRALVIVDTLFPGVSVTLQALSLADLRAIAAEFAEVADLIESDDAARAARAA